MRIVGGEFRGRRLAEPSNLAIRPTTDRNRESLFNIITHNWGDYLINGSVIDGFAGTGALGLEALSRGARFATFVEKSPQGIRLIEENIDTLKVAATTQILRRDATKVGQFAGSEAADLVFLDPPYGKGLGEKAADALLLNGWLKPNALVVLEEEKSKLPSTLSGFVTADQRNFGDTSIGFFVIDQN